MRQNGRHATRRIAKAERQSESLMLRKVGLSVRQIAAKTGVSHTQAIKDVQAALDDLAASQRVTTEQYRALQTERLHGLLTACYSKAIHGDLDAIKVAASIVDQLSKLHGLYGVPPDDPAASASIVASPQFALIVNVLLSELAGHDDLRYRIAAGIAALTDEATG